MVPRIDPLPFSASFKIRSNWTRGARSSNGFSFDILRIVAKPLPFARDLIEQLAEEQSPGYVGQHAQQQGLQPADPKNVHTIVVQNLQPIPDQYQP